MRVLVTRHVFPDALAILRDVAGITELDYHDSHDGLPDAELRQRIRGARGVVCQLTDPITAEVMDAAGEQLGVLANVAVGYDNIDMAAAGERGILVTNTPGVLTGSTADLTWALILATARRLTEAERFLRDGRWQRWEIDLLCGQDVHRRKLGIVGMGRIGQAVARRAAGFEMEVLYHSRSALAAEREAELRARRVDLDELLSQADVVSLHVPLDEATRHMVGHAELLRMKPSAILVNTARGPIVDETALVEALAAGRIAGAGLDVFEDEPVPAPGLLELDNVVLLPHIASASITTRTRMCTMAAENLAAFLRGEEPPNVVHPNR